MTKAESIYSELTNKADEIAHLGADSIRFSGNWESSIRTLNAIKKIHEIRESRFSRLQIKGASSFCTPEKENILRIVSNSIDNENKRLRSL